MVRVLLRLGEKPIISGQVSGNLYSKYILQVEKITGKAMTLQASCIGLAIMKAEHKQAPFAKNSQRPISPVIHVIGLNFPRVM